MNSDSLKPSYESLDPTRTFDFLMIGCFTMLILGFGFMFIYLGIIRLLPLALGYSKFVYQVIGRFLIKNPKQEFTPLPLKSWKTVSLILAIIIDVMYLGLGIWSLVRFGFLGQNFLYMFLHYGFRVI